jgi:hypothetical protein
MLKVPGRTKKLSNADKTMKELRITNLVPRTRLVLRLNEVAIMVVIGDFLPLENTYPMIVRPYVYNLTPICSALYSHFVINDIK